MSEKYTKIGNLSVSKVLFNFINKEAIPGTDIDEKKFWKSFDDAIHKLLPKNNELLDTRHKLQMDIDRWHLNNKGKEFKIKEYEKFLKEIGYLKEEGKDFKIDTKNIEDEIAKIAGPQLVVPVMNARYALNAANARWGSLYDALYGTDVIPGDKGKDFNEDRAKKVIDYV